MATPTLTRERRSTGLSGVLFGLLAASTFGMSGVTARPLMEAGWSPGATVLLRMTLAVTILAIPTLRALRGRWHVVRAKSPVLIVFGIVAVAGGQVCFYNAVSHLSIGVSLLLEYSGILLVVAWNWLRTKVPPTVLTSIGAVIALVGLFVLLGVADGARLSTVGVLWGLGGAVGLAAFYILAARTEDGLPPIPVVAVGMSIGIVGLLLAAAVGLLPLHATFGSVSWNGAIMPWFIPGISLGTISGAIAFVAGVQASRHLGSTMASFFGLTEVIFAILFAWLILAEVPASQQLLGGVGVLVGVVLVRIGELRRPPDLALAVP